MGSKTNNHTHAPGPLPATDACEQRSSKRVRFCATGRSYHREPTPIKGVALDAKIIGNVMPVLEVALNRGETLVDESGEQSWMTESSQLRTSTRTACATGIFGPLKRMAAGGGFMTEVRAYDRPGRIAFAAKLPHWPVVDCSDSPTPPMTQHYLRPCLTNAASCLQAARYAIGNPRIGGFEPRRRAR